MNRATTSSLQGAWSALAEFYPEALTARSLELYQQVRGWAEDRGGITLIGGWAVYELVEPLRAQRSRDLDLVLHTADTLHAFSARLPEWGLTWRSSGRSRFKDCHFRDDEDRRIMVDVFTTRPFAKGLFGRQANTNLKDAAGQGFIPGLDYLLRDKVATVPLRQGRDAERKQLKDCLDIYNLVFYNEEGRLPGELRSVVPLSARRAAKGEADRLIERFPDHREPLAVLVDWLVPAE